MQCSQQFALPWHHLWTLLAVLSTCSLYQPPAATVKRDTERKSFECMYLCVCVYVNAHPQTLCREANNKLSCRLICIDKGRHNLSSLKEAAMTVTHRKACRMSPSWSLYRLMTDMVTHWTHNTALLKHLITVSIQNQTRLGVLAVLPVPHGTQVWNWLKLVSRWHVSAMIWQQLVHLCR